MRVDLDDDDDFDALALEDKWKEGVAPTRCMSACASRLFCWARPVNRDDDDVVAADIPLNIDLHVLNGNASSLKHIIRHHMFVQ